MFSSENLSDNELVQRFLNGDQKAFEILILRHKNRVYSYILLIVKKQDLAEDIFQETFIKVIRSLKHGRYTDNGKFISWVLRISHNLIIDHFRKENSSASSQTTAVRLTYSIPRNSPMIISKTRWLPVKSLQKSGNW